MRPIYLVSFDEVHEKQRVDHFPEAFLGQTSIGVYTLDFVGSIAVEATICLDPQEDDWFEVWREVFSVKSQNEPTALNHIVNVVGRFVWMRAKVEKDLNVRHGVVDRITVI